MCERNMGDMCMYKCRGSMKELEMSAHVVVVAVAYTVSWLGEKWT